MKYNEDLPGYKEASELGYSLVYHGGTRKLAGYAKEGVHLDIRSKETGLEASLSFIWRLLTVTTLDFSFPNKNFKVFEDQVNTARRRLSNES